MHDPTDDPTPPMPPDVAPAVADLADLWAQVDADAADLARRREVMVFLLDEAAQELEELRARRDLLAADVVDALAAAGVSQRALARRIGVQPGSLAHVVGRGRRLRNRQGGMPPEDD